MANKFNLDLDVDHHDDKDAPAVLVRVVVPDTNGYTRDGAAAIVSLDCANQRALEKEIERLTTELDRALEIGRRVFEGLEPMTEQSPAGSDVTPRGSAISANHKPHLDANLKVQDVMTRQIEALHENDSLVRAEELMQSKHIRHVVVLDEDDKLAGIVSHRDIVFNRMSRALGHGKHARDAALETFSVKQVMESKLATITPGADLHEASTLMIERSVGCLPVVDGDKLVGILTQGDFLALISPDKKSA